MRIKVNILNITFINKKYIMKVFKFVDAGHFKP